MSTMTFVVLVAKILTAPPPLPAATMAALALIRPSSEFKVAVRGCDCPVGHTVRYPKGPIGIPDGVAHRTVGYPKGPIGTTETLSEKAMAPRGTRQVPCPI